MDKTKITAIFTMLFVVLAITAVSGCTTGSMTVSPTPLPTVAPTAQPAAVPTAAPTVAPTTVPQATPAPAEIPAFVKGWGPYPTTGPWAPGNDTLVPTPTPAAWYLLSMPWIDQKIQVVGPVVLKITGNVEKPLYLTMYQLKNDYPQRKSSWNLANPAKAFTGTGPELNALLDAARPKPGAINATFIAGPPRAGSFPTPLTIIRADPDAIVAFVSDGSLRCVLPSQESGKVQTQYLIEIVVV